LTVDGGCKGLSTRQELFATLVICGRGHDQRLIAPERAAKSNQLVARFDHSGPSQQIAATPSTPGARYIAFKILNRANEPLAERAPTARGRAKCRVDAGAGQGGAGFVFAPVLPALTDAADRTNISKHFFGLNY
jgi:hypothetical protein